MFSVEDIDTEINSKQEIISKLKSLRRELEGQMVTFGLYVPPYITLQITELTNQITQKEQELVQLRIQAVETTLPIAEVEYRALVAEAWSRSSGWLSAVDEARLELERLRLAITEGRSNEHHSVVRSRLAVEMLLDLELNNIQGDPSIRSNAVQRIIRAFRLDPQKAEDLIQLNIDGKNIQILVEWLNTTRTIWRSEEERNSINLFFQRLLQSNRIFVGDSQNLIKTPQSWKGKYHYGSSSREIPMTLIIEQVVEGSFSGEARYSTLGNTITKIIGEITRIVDVSETNKWSLISKYSLESEELFIKFTEVDYIQGQQAQLDGWYYGVITKDGKLFGIWFPSDTAVHPQADFQLDVMLGKPS